MRKHVHDQIIFRSVYNNHKDTIDCNFDNYVINYYMDNDVIDFNDEQ